MRVERKASYLRTDGYPKIGRQKFLARLQPVLTPNQFEKVELAYEFAKYGHRGQMRDDGVRYFEHPKAVALILIHELGVTDWRDIVLALLHDMFEDSFLLTERLVERLFGQDVVRDLKLLTKKPKDGYVGRLRRHGSAQTLRVKLCDRLHNLRTLHRVSKRKQRKQIEETRAKYIPLADLLILRLPRKNRWQGWQLQRELEKMCEILERGR